MGSQGFPSVEFSTSPVDGRGRSIPLASGVKGRRRYGLHLLLFVVTLITTTAVGAQMSYNFENNLPGLNGDVTVVFQALRHPARLVHGLPFSVTLILILLAHEMGHYVVCQYYRINATLPFFLPAPTLIGTFGAFIRIRSPIYTRRALFDVGVAGPLAGFVFLLPALAIGLAYSKIIPGIAERGELLFGIPPLQKILHALILPGVSPADLSLHPIARAAWVGVLATALNLLPIGQLDGGHILYSFVGRKHRLLSAVFVVALIPIGLFFSYSWLVWAAILFVLGMRHPPIQDASELGTGRRKLGLLALLILILSFTVAPVELSDSF